MSTKHPVIAVTGSSGAGTTTVKNAFTHIFQREKVLAAVVEGDSYHRFDRVGMRKALKEAHSTNKQLSHFGPEGNVFEEIEKLFKTYGQTGGGNRRFYLHSEEESEPYGQKPGEFTPWEELPQGTDLLFYEGLHGGVRDGDTDVAQFVDLLIGVVPIVNLEWIQKIHRDNEQRGYEPDVIVDTILRRMYDYIHYITPQFSRTDINFQRVPTVDTSNPFITRDIPTADESMIVIRFTDPAKFNVNFPYLISMIHDSYMSRRNTLVVPGGKMGLAMELILTPIIHNLIEKRRFA